MVNTKKLFSYKHGDVDVQADIELPYNSSIEELVNILITTYKLPRYIEKDMRDNLLQFVTDCNTEFFNVVTTDAIDNAKANYIDFEDITKEWEKLMREEMAEYGEKRCASDEELFATAYHKMVHSPALETMLQYEHMYNQKVRKRCEEKDLQINQLSERQTEEMTKAVDRLETDMTEGKINELAAQHFETQTLIQVQLMSELETIKETQRREYREWLMQMLEENQANSSLPTPSFSSSHAPAMPPRAYDHQKHISEPSILEESFTIHLGSQLKQMHNIRILSANVMNLCEIDSKEYMGEPTPQILQTSLALYSNDLHGLVLMTDNTIRSRINKEFRDICHRSTEFHFTHIDDQLDKITDIKDQLTTEQRQFRKSSKYLQSGDFYMTKHSNLSQAHVIFHLVADDTLKGNDINSRHPVVLGLRNILKTACSNDITSLTIPLLLNYEMSEEMTISWCEKRAELVFKCVKGFMIEMASWGGSDLKNLQFMLPQGISSEVFQSLTEMLPRIFKVSNPLILKTRK